MKRHILLYLSLAIIFVFQQNVICQTSEISVSNHKSIKIETDKIFNKLVEIRRNFHQNPELAGKEINTQKVVKQYLLDLGLDVKTDFYGYGLVGILQGEKKGKKIAWRADMDAIPSDFPDNVDFKSNVKGVQHGCGHDIHLAIALGIAEVLTKNKKSLAGTVYFIFQPEEETFNGAKGMVSKGLFAKIRPDEIYGLHITPASVGQIVVKSNEMYAYQRKISIKLKNTLSDNTLQKLTADIKKLLSRNITDYKPWDIQNALNPQIGMLNPNTIFKDYLFVDNNYFSTYSKGSEQFIDFYVYETDPRNLPNLIPQVKKKLIENGYQDRLISISFTQANPTVVNDEKLTNASVKIIKKLYGEEAIAKSFGQIPFSNDDFAYFQQKVPGVYFFLGGSNFAKGIIAMNHAPNFNVDEESIRIGVTSFSSLIFERLKIGKN